MNNEEDRSEQGDGNYDAVLNGKEVVEEVRTKISEKDGVEEVHVTYVPKKKINKYFNFSRGYDTIDWSN